MIAENKNKFHQTASSSLLMQERQKEKRQSSVVRDRGNFQIENVPIERCTRIRSSVHLPIYQRHFDV
jgi:hypothetical protein